MNHVERFRAAMNFQQVDRLPRWEWAMWWDETVKRWHGEGLPVDIIDIFVETCIRNCSKKLNELETAQQITKGNL